MPLPGLPQVKMRTPAESRALRLKLEAEEAAKAAALPPKKPRGRPRVRPIPDPAAPKRPPGRPPRKPLDPEKVAKLLAEQSPLIPPGPDPERKRELPEPRELPPSAAPPPEAEPLPAAAQAREPQVPPASSNGHEEAALIIPEATVPATVEQRQMVDEYGELDRRMQLRATDAARFEALKRGIKGWFDTVPADADGTVEGDGYLLHLSARERERKVRVRDLAERIGVERTLELATVAIGALEAILSKAEIESLITETRSGSRRIKAIPKYAIARTA